MNIQTGFAKFHVLELFCSWIILPIWMLCLLQLLSSFVPLDAMFIRGLATFSCMFYWLGKFQKWRIRVVWVFLCILFNLITNSYFVISDLGFVFSHLAVAGIVRECINCPIQLPILGMSITAMLVLAISWFPPLENAIYHEAQVMHAGIVSMIGAKGLGCNYVALPSLIFYWIACLIRPDSPKYIRIVWMALGTTLAFVAWICSSLSNSTFAFYFSMIGCNIILTFFACALCLNCKAEAAQLVRVSKHNYPNRQLTIATGCVVIMCLVSSVVPNGSLDTNRIVFLNAGGIDWVRPTYDMSEKKSGMFGLLPVYLESGGFECNSMQLSDLPMLQEMAPCTLVMMNLGRIWQPSEKSLITSFLMRGGSLVILGDHTDVFDLQKGFNSLLSNIQFNFDSAYPIRENWRGSLTSVSSSPMRQFSVRNQGVAIGASLTVQGWAQRLVYSHHGFSDTGIRENYVGSFLGNYHRDPTESAGNCVLIAKENIGKGRIVVFGDTSAFQNGIPYNFDSFVFPFFMSLQKLNGWSESKWGMISIGLLVVLGSAACYLRIAWPFPLLWITLAILSHEFVEFGTSNSAQHALPIMVIDESHLPYIGHSESLGYDCGSLYTELLRTGQILKRSDSLTKSLSSAPTLIAFVEPSRQFSNSEVEQLLEYERAGGNILLAIGPMGAASLDRLLATNGVSIGRCLGAIQESVDGEKLENAPRFRRAHALELHSELSTPILLSGQRVLCSLSKYGKGKLVVVGDPTFFCKANAMKGMFDAFPGNRTLCEDVQAKHFKTNILSTSPFFPEPPELP